MMPRVGREGFEGTDDEEGRETRARRKKRAPLPWLCAMHPISHEKSHGT